jgi:hypothetical protein
MKKKDILKHYMVSPKENRISKKPLKTEVLLKCIYVHIQNNEIYFKYEPTFYKGIIIFGVIGFQSDHDTLKKILGNAIGNLECTLQETLTKEG